MRDSWLFKKIFGCIAGVAIGDAMCMPAEGLTPNEIREIYGKIVSFLEPKVENACYGLPAGHITDDTEETILLIEVILEKNGEITAQDFANALLTWAEKGLDSKKYIGPSTKKAIENLRKGYSILESGERNVTCGAAMRIAPIGLLYAGNEELAAKKAAEISLVTHGGNAATSAASAVAAAIATAMRKNATIEMIIDSAIKGARIGKKYGKDVVSPSIEKRINLAVEIANKYEENIDKVSEELYDLIGTWIHSAEVVPTAFGIIAATKGDPMKAINIAINMGGDTDTIAAIAGAIGGAFKGIDSMDINDVRFIERVNNINIELFARKLWKIIKLPS
ncbi:MAG: ADP-ribosylglycohydrolase family protein [Candidatus Asgardarchaeia archaeon]